MAKFHMLAFMENRRNEEQERLPPAEGENVIGAF
jgi:hypothetical protein